LFGTQRAQVLTSPPEKCAFYRNPLFNALVYPLQGFAAHKGAFCGSAEQTYCALKKGLTLSQLVKMPRACNVV
jgi:hypothetical protein